MARRSQGISREPTNVYFVNSKGNRAGQVSDRCIHMVCHMSYLTCCARGASITQGLLANRQIIQDMHRRQMQPQNRRTFRTLAPLVTKQRATFKPCTQKLFHKGHHQIATTEPVVGVGCLTAFVLQHARGCIVPDDCR